MSLPPLTILPAGAGSGKTHAIQERLADWVIKGEVAPDRILAVTFTEAAASELKGRIRSELVKRGRIEDALKLEQSYISTIHGFGLRVLTEFAFDRGVSPAPRLLDDDERKLLVRKALSATEKADFISRDLDKFGYRYDHAGGESPEDVFRATILGVIDKLRSLGPRGNDIGLIGLAGERLERGYGPTEPADALEGALLTAVRALLEKHPASLETMFAGKKTVTEQFHKDYANLKRAASGALAGDWKLWSSLRDLRLSRRGSETPPEYDELARRVMAAAGALQRHPGPLADAKKHAEALIGAAMDILGRYAEGKERDSLVDYADMVAGAWELLANDRQVLGHLKDRIDCLVIDEFQDTNPTQFSLLWTLRASGIPALVVGDLKQAIMGFQSADPRLFQALLEKHPGDCKPLTENWRSSERLMPWINAVGRSLFGDGYVELKARAGFESTMEPLEVLDAPEYIRANATRASWTAVRVRSLLDDPVQEVWDRHAGAARRLRGGDIAVICRTRSLVDTYAASLRALNIRTRVESGGWLASPIVRIACHALAWVADPLDRHAALYLAATEIGNRTLQDALDALGRDGRISDPVLEKLEPLRGECSVLTVEAALGRVIEVLDLYGLIATWPDAGQSRANLLRLQAEASAFRDAHRQILIAGGYYGAGIKTFLAWLEARALDEDGQPDARALDEDAVTVSTWHSAKGLEWPVVAVCGLQNKVEPRFPHFSIEWDALDDLTRAVAGASLSVIPVFEAQETRERFIPPLQKACEEEDRRLLYVALTRAREKVILEWPSHLKEKEGVTYWSLLAGNGEIGLEEGGLRVGKETFPCLVHKAGKEEAATVTEGRKTPLVEPLPLLGRRAILPAALPENLTPEAITPSFLRPGTGVSGTGGFSTEKYAEPPQVAIDAGAAERGTLLHRCFELLDGESGAREKLEAALGPALGAAQLEALASAAGAFRSWLWKRFAPVSVASEVPVLGLDEKGSVVSGVIDLLLETAEGYWIIDHKSDRPDDTGLRFREYLPQLLCYAGVVGSLPAGKPVLGVAVHWIMLGEATLLKL